MRILEQQSLFDIAIQSCGSAEAAFELAVLNGVSVTDELPAGSEVKLTEARDDAQIISVKVVDKSIVSFYTNKNLNPATADVRDTDSANRILFEELSLEFF